MKHRSKSHIYFFGDCSETWDVVRNMCKRMGAEVSCFASTEGCLKSLRCQRCDLLIVEMKMCEVGELVILHEVKKLSPWLPILIVYASSSVQAAVTLMKIGAFDLIKEPLSEPRLLSAIRSALEGPTLPEPLPEGEELTPAEKRILCLILHGKSNRETAAILNRSIKTVEAHRSHIMHKLGVDNVVDLTKRAIAMRLIDWPPPN